MCKHSGLQLPFNLVHALQLQSIHDRPRAIGGNETSDMIFIPACACMHIIAADDPRDMLHTCMHNGLIRSEGYIL